MSKITLKKLSLLNFKGIKNLTIDFDANTNIYGDNATGKTSVFDAFVWLLFGKDSTDRKDFEIKTLDKDNNVIPKIDHEVSAELGVDGDIISVKRVFREKWVKTKGRLEAEFSGNETLYYWNEVPLTMKEFQNKVSEILDEQVFKLITSPAAFNNLKWQERRDVLVKIAGDVSDAELAKGNADYLELLSQLTNKTLDEYKKQIASTIKKAKDDIKQIPTRIDEAERNKPEPVDEETVNAEILAKEKLIDNIDNQLQDKAVAYDEVIKKRNANQDEIYNLKAKQNTIRFDISEKARQEEKTDNSKSDVIRKGLDDVRAEIKQAEAKRDTLADKRNSVKTQISTLETLITNGRTKWNEVNSKTFEFNENTVCPCCNQPIPESDIEEKRSGLLENFNTDKQNQLKRISENGKANATEKANLETELATLEERIQKGTDYVLEISKKETELQADLLLANNEAKSNEKPTLESVVEKLISENEEYQSLTSKIAELEALKFDLPENGNQELKEEKAKLQSEINELKSSLQVNVQIGNANKRIAELQKEESKLAQEIANIEKTQYTIENFIKLKVDTIEEKINQKFSFVKFKLFVTQINGGQVECCDALINGVPFSDANTASKINAGIDIINSLCEFYKVSAPIFIDNRESVVKLIDSDSQIINLIVSPDDKKLRVI